MAGLAIDPQASALQFGVPNGQTVPQVQPAFTQTASCTAVNPAGNSYYDQVYRDAFGSLGGPITSGNVTPSNVLGGAMGTLLDQGGSSYGRSGDSTGGSNTGSGGFSITHSGSSSDDTSPANSSTTNSLGGSENPGLFGTGIGGSTGNTIGGAISSFVGSLAGNAIAPGLGGLLGGAVASRGYNAMFNGNGMTADQVNAVNAMPAFNSNGITFGDQAPNSSGELTGPAASPGLFGTGLGGPIGYAIGRGIASTAGGLLGGAGVPVVGGIVGSTIFGKGYDALFGNSNAMSQDQINAAENSPAFTSSGITMSQANGDTQDIGAPAAGELGLGGEDVNGSGDPIGPAGVAGTIGGAADGNGPGTLGGNGPGQAGGSVAVGDGNLSVSYSGADPAAFLSAYGDQGEFGPEGDIGAGGDDSYGGEDAGGSGDNGGPAGAAGDGGDGSGGDGGDGSGGSSGGGGDGGGYGGDGGGGGGGDE